MLDEPFASVDTPLRRQLRQDARGRVSFRRHVDHYGDSRPRRSNGNGGPYFGARRWRCRSTGHAGRTGKTLRIDLSLKPSQAYSHLGQVEGDHIVTAFGNLPRANLGRAGNLSGGESIELGVRQHDCRQPST